MRKTELASVDSIEVQDSYTVTLHLKNPDATLLAQLADRAGMVLSKDAIRKGRADFSLKPVGAGTGPFEFVEWKRDDHLTLQKNPNYWRHGIPYLDQVVYRANTNLTATFASNRCLKALPWLPVYAGAEVRESYLVHIPGARSFSVLAATRDDIALADQTLGQALLSAGWTSEPAVVGVLIFRQQSGARETARVIWGPDPIGRLQTAFMLSIDLPEGALSELPQ